MIMPDRPTPSVEQLPYLGSHVAALRVDYGSTHPDSLRERVNITLAELVELRDSRKISYRDHAEILRLAGWLALLSACCLWDTGNRERAEKTREAAAGIGEDLSADDPDILAWSWEVLAWMQSTDGRHSAVLDSTDHGLRVADDREPALQLLAHRARAHARLGDADRARASLEHAYDLHATLTPPADPRQHFTVDSVKLRFLSMPVWRSIGDDERAADAATEVLNASHTTPMHDAEARLTLATVHARARRLDMAFDLISRALPTDREPLPPSLLTLGREVTSEMAAAAGEDPRVQRLTRRLHGR